MNDLKKITGLEAIVNAAVADLAEKNETLREELSPYAHGVVTADTLKEWKAERARIEKGRKTLDTERKAVEGEWKNHLKPLLDAYKEGNGIYLEAIGNIDNQMDDFEEKRKAGKRAQIERLFNSYIAPEGIEGWITLESIWNEKWLNATYAAKDISADIEKAFTKCKMEYELIKSMNDKYEADGLKVLRRTGSMKDAIETMNFLKLCEVRVREEDAQPVELPQEAEKPVTEAHSEPEDDIPAFDAGLNYTFTVKVPADKAEEFAKMLDSLGYEYNSEE